RNRRRMQYTYAEDPKRLIRETPNSQLVTAVPTLNTIRTIKYADNEVRGVFTQGTTDEFVVTSVAQVSQGRFFTETESRGAQPVCVLGYDVAEALFPNRSALGNTVLIDGNPFRVIGVFVKQGTFLGLFSVDTYAVVPMSAFMKVLSSRLDTSIRVKVKDKNRLAAARDELTGHMRRVRGLAPEQNDDFSINEQEGIRSSIGP